MIAKRLDFAFTIPQISASQSSTLDNINHCGKHDTALSAVSNKQYSVTRSRPARDADIGVLTGPRLSSYQNLAVRQ